MRGYTVGIVITNISTGQKIGIQDIELTSRTLIGVDASTDTTGICFVSESYFIPLYSISLKREKGTSAVEYKIEFKRLMEKLLLENRSIYKYVRQIVQEEPFMSAMKTTSSVLMSLRTSVPELLIERKEYLEEFTYSEINNKTWKKEFFYPDKCTNNSETEKKMAMEKLSTMYPIYKTLTQDEVDAACLGIVSCRKIAKGEKIESKKPARRFNYEIEFIGAFDIQSALDEIPRLSIPKCVTDNGVNIFKIPSNGNLDKKIFTEMGDEDMVLMFEFSKKNAGNIVLKYRIHDLASRFDNIYGVVWRKNRKK